MKRKLLSWVLAIALMAGSFAPAIPSYAAEETAEAVDGASLLASAEDSSFTEASEEASEEVSVEAAAELSSEEITPVQDEEEPTEDASEKASEEATTEEAATEEASEAAEEAADEASAEISSEEALPDEAVEDASLVDITTTPVTNIKIRLSSGEDIAEKGAPAMYSMLEGDTERIFVDVFPEDAIDNSFTLKSTDTTVATVDENGYIKAIKSGETEIIATTKGKDEGGNTIEAYIDLTVVSRSAPKKKLKTAKFEKDKYYADQDADESGIITVTALFDSEYVYGVSWYLDVLIGAGTSVDYDATVTNGKASNKIKLSTAGVYKITATTTSAAYETKQISCFVYYNGIRAGNFLQDGNYIGGWIGLDAGGKFVANGAGVLKNTKVAKIIYAKDGSFDLCVHEAFTIGKKKYYFGDDYYLVRGTTDTDITSAPGYCINKLGEIQTGWVKVGDKEYYFDPETGLICKSAWVPRGNSWSRTSAEGALEENNGHKVINGRVYFFSKGARVTGFIYLNKDYESIKAANAVYVAYFDPETGILRDQPFTIKGKLYVPEKVQKVMPIKQMYQGVDLNYHYGDKDGSVVKSKFIEIEGKYVYADADGNLVENGVMIINGKTYKFKDFYRYDTGKDTTDFFFKGEGADEYKVAYTTNKNYKKLTDGLMFVDALDEPLKECWLYEKIGNEEEGYTYSKVYYLDSKGNPLTGVAHADFFSYWFDPVTARLGTEDKIVSYKKKLYLFKKGKNDSERIIQTFPSVYGAPEGPYEHNLCVVKDSTGALAVNTIAEVDGAKYIVGSDGIVMYDMYSTINFKGKYYLAGNTKGTYTYASDVSILTGKEGLIDYGLSIYFVNKDGTVKTGGFIKYGTSKVYATKNGELTFGKSFIITISGKSYNFGDETNPVMQTGWMRISNPILVNMENYSQKSFSGDYFFYFDKNGVMVKGWKKMDIPKLNSAGTDIELDAGSNPVIMTGTKDNLLFNNSDSSYPMGALVCNRDIVVNGKVYRMAANGVAKKDAEGLTTINGEDAYLKADGSFAKGRTAVKEADGSTSYYYFDADGKMECFVIRKTGSKWYYYGLNGKMSTELEMECKQYQLVRAVFNKDGSIKCFMGYVNSVEKKLKNETLQEITEKNSSKILLNLIVLGSNGLPRTGMVTCNVGSNVTGKLLIESDGKVFRGLSSMYYLYKQGSKYYVIALTGQIVTDTSSSYTVDYSLLPAKDIEELDKYSNYRDEFSGTRTIKVWPKNDGTVSARTVNSGIHTNKYGIAIEDYSFFVKQGKNWYINSSESGVVKGSTGSVLLKAKGITDKSLTSNAVVSWNNNLKVISITDRDTGKPVEGFYALERGTGEGGMIVYIKNGLPVCGKQIISSGNTPLTFVLDNYGGNAEDVFGYLSD